MIVDLAARGSDCRRFGDGVFVREENVVVNAISSWSRVRDLNWVKLLVHFCSHELVKGLADLGGVMYNLIPASDELSHMHVIVCVGER